MSRATRFLLGGWTLAVAVTAMAQQPAMRVYSMSEGLKYSQVFCVYQGKDGFLWAGTSYGVSRYDGHEFQTLTRASGLPHDSVLDLAEDAEGNVWALTQEGLARIAPSGGERGGPKLLPPRPDWAQLPVSDLRRLASAGKTVWLLGTSAIWRTSQAGTSTFPMPGGRTLADPVQLGPASDDDVWLASPEAVVRIQANGPAELPAWPQDLGSPVSLTRTGDGIVLLQKEGVSVYRQGHFEADPEWSLPAGLNPESATAQGSSLVVTTPGRGAAILVKGRPPRILSRQHGLPSDAVNAALHDRDGILWLATEDGLAKVFDLSVESFRSRDPEIGNQVLAVTEGLSGEIWIGHSNGLTRLVDGSLQLFEPFPEKSEDNAVWAVLPVSARTVLCGTRGGLVAFTNGKPKWIRLSRNLSQGRVFCLRRISGGKIGAGTLAGLVTFEWDEERQTPVNIEVIDKEGDAPLGEVRGLDGAPEGTLWGGTDGNGVFLLSKGRIRRFGSGGGLPSGVCRAVLGISATEALVGTDIGLYGLRDGNWRSIPAVNQRFEKPYVVALARGEKGRVWVALTDRLLELEGDTVLRVIDRTGGLVGLSTTAENCLALDSRGGLWVGMVGGVTKMGASAAHPSIVPDIRVLEAVSTSGRVVSRGERLSYRENSISFAYRSPTFLAEERTRFEDRLLGYETAWNLARLSPSQRYTNLLPGSYTLEVRAVSASGLRSPPASFPFSITPPWWETAWARTLFALAVAASILGVIRWRTFQLRQNAELLKRQVAERTRELNEANRDLQRLQERLAELVETGGQAREDVRAWASSQASELKEALAAEGISVTQIEEGKLRLLFGKEPPVTAEVIDNLTGDGREFASGSDFFLPIRASAGDLVGILGVRGRAGGLAGGERRLAIAFAHQIGGALDVRRLHKRLQSVESARAAVRVELAREGTVTASVCPKCGRCYPGGTLKCEDDAFLLEAHGLLPIRIQGRYQLLQKLGQGGMGVVYLAQDEELAREVALKIIRPELFDDPGIRQRFKREAKAAARIQHQGIVAVHDTGELADGSAFLVMERLQGADLASIVGRYGMGRFEQVASVARQAGSALAAAHRAGIVHRDIKPENLFLVPQPGGFVVKILDFGLARSASLADGLTQTGMVVGTPGYLSPEQVRGESATPRSDLYSLAATLWEAVTGARAVRSEVLSEIYLEILNKRIPPVSLLRLGAPTEVDQAFERALEKNAAARPADTEEWTASLSAILARLDDGQLGWPI